MPTGRFLKYFTVNFIRMTLKQHSEHNFPNCTTDTLLFMLMLKTDAQMKLIVAAFQMSLNRPPLQALFQSLVNITTSNNYFADIQLVFEKTVHIAF